MYINLNNPQQTDIKLEKGQTIGHLDCLQMGMHEPKCDIHFIEYKSNAEWKSN